MVKNLFWKEQARSNMKINFLLNNLGLITKIVWETAFFQQKLVSSIFIILKGHIVQIKENYKHFDCNGLPPISLSSDSINKRNGKNFFNEKIQGKDNQCAAYCLYSFIKTKKVKTDFISNVIHSFYNKHWQKEKMNLVAV